MLTYGIPPEFRGGVHMKPPYAIGSVPSLSGHAIAYRWRSLPRVRRQRASKPQGSSERVLPWQITMDQLIFASLSHTHYWYEVGMLKVPAEYNQPGAPVSITYPKTLPKPIMPSSRLFPIRVLSLKTLFGCDLNYNEWYVSSTGIIFDFY